MRNVNSNNPQNATSTSAQKPQKGFAKKVGDAIEKLGEKVADAGLPKAGDAIERFGDKIEHKGEKNRVKRPS